MFSRLEHERLQAMGLTVYHSVDFAPPALPATPAAQTDSGFWQTRLGLNIRRHAEGIDTTALPIPVSGAEGKKSVWTIIRKLRKSR